MKKSIFAFLFVILASQSAFSKEKWLVYQSQYLKSEIQYPTSWKVYVLGPDMVRLTPSEPEEWMRSLGVPAPPNPWFDVHRLSKGKLCVNFLKQSKNFRRSNPGVTDETGPEREKFVCKNNLVVSMGYWESALYKKGHKKILESILKSFKKIP